MRRGEVMSTTSKCMVGRNMRKVGHGKIALTSYHIPKTTTGVYCGQNEVHPISIEVDVFLGSDGELKFVYTPTDHEQNFLVIETENNTRKKHE